MRSRAGPPPSPTREHWDPGGQGCAPIPARPQPHPPRLPPPSRPARSGLPGRTYLLAAGRAAPRRPLGGSEEEGTGQGGSGGSWSAADRAPPAAGEGARRVSVGREREAAAGARPPPSLGPPLSRPRALARETRGQEPAALGAGAGRGEAMEGRGRRPLPRLSGDLAAPRDVFPTPGRTQDPFQVCRSRVSSLSETRWLTGAT